MADSMVVDWVDRRAALTAESSDTRLAAKRVELRAVQMDDLRADNWVGLKAEKTADMSDLWWAAK